MLVTIRVNNSAGHLENVVRVGQADSPEKALEMAHKRAREIEPYYSTWSNFEYTYGGRILAENLDGQVTLGEVVQ